MKQGRSWEEIAKELEEQASGRRDYLAPSGAIDFRLLGGEAALGLPVPGLSGAAEYFFLRDVAHEQLASWLRIPKPYYDLLRAEAPRLYFDTVRYWLANQERKYLLRTLGTDLRAVLSTRYRPLDNDALAAAVLPVLEERGFAIESSEVTDSRLYIKAVTPRIEGEVRPGDVVRMGVTISNSEVGAGALRIDPLLFFLACTNGLVVAASRLRKFHVGRDAGDIESAREFFRDETREADDVAFWMKVQDALRVVLAPEHFQQQLEKLRGATRDAISAPPEKVIEVTAKRFRLTEEERGSVLRHFFRGHNGQDEPTRYGLAQAISRASQDVPHYERATELEEISGHIVGLGPAEWRGIAEARA
jgi:hypothetical protein